MLKDKLQPFLDRYNKISELLADEKITQDIKKLTELSKEQSDLQKIVNKANEYIQTIESIEENKELLSDKELA
jgi:peptide chain release factor 1